MFVDSHVPTRRHRDLTYGVILLLLVGIAGRAFAHETHRHQAAQTPRADASDTRSATGTLAPTIPDVPLITQEGHDVRFYRDLVQGKVVAINFIYTTCELTCPLLGVNFRVLQQTLKERVGADVHLISVSIDPQTDTPARLKTWGERLGAGAGWTLLTGSKRHVDRVLKALEVFAADKTDHSTFILLGNEPERQWKRINGLTSGHILATELRNWLDAS